MKIFYFVCTLIVLLTFGSGSTSVVYAQESKFRRVGTFHICRQFDTNCNTNTTTSAEIVTASKDGKTLIYSDSPNKNIGFVDITNPALPVLNGTVALTGEPTSVDVVGGFAVVCVNTSPNFTTPSGFLAVINIATRAILKTFDLGGQPDSVTVTSDEKYVVIAIENERDEAVGSGRIPQLPAGFVVVIDSSNVDPNMWTTKQVNVTGLPNVLYPEDPEPEYVDCNSNNICVVTLQENNALVTFDAVTGNIINSFSAGADNLTNIDLLTDSTILQTQSLANRLREPDAVVWMGSPQYFATANEGDLDGGSRGFTVFDAVNGSVVFTTTFEMDRESVRYGNYPEGRSRSKGVEPEGAAYAEFTIGKFLFILLERANSIFVYNVGNPLAPVLFQVLSASTPGPEGIVTIPGRNLFAIANEVDNRASAMRSSIDIFELSTLPPSFPSLLSSPRLAGGGAYIPFSALSGLAAMPPFGVVGEPKVLYTVEDSFYKKNRILTIDVVNKTVAPFTITSETPIVDTNSVLANVLGAANFSKVNVTLIINGDKTVNIDPEGIAVSALNGRLWVASEGAGTGMALTLPNMILSVNASTGTILEVILLPSEVNALQDRFGFEGIAEYKDQVVVCFQRAWLNETNPRIGIYNYVTKIWKFVYYPLDVVESLNGGWVGMSDLAPLTDGKFLVLERDNQGGPDAVIKRLYEINLGPDLNTLVSGATVTKTLKLNIYPELAKTWGNIPEKVEGVAVDSKGMVWINNDNDGVNNNSGEQQLNTMGKLYTPPVPLIVPVTPAPVPAPIAAPVVPPVRPPFTVVTRSPTYIISLSPIEPPMAAPPKGCGLLGLRVFCFNGCGFFGRLLGLCKE